MRMKLSDEQKSALDCALLYMKRLAEIELNAENNKRYTELHRELMGGPCIHSNNTTDILDALRTLQNALESLHYNIKHDKLEKIG